jgi:hypothetical protein
MLRAMLLSRPKPPQPGAEGQPLQGHRSQRQLSTKVSGPPLPLPQPLAVGRIDRFGVRNSPTQNSKEPLVRMADRAVGVEKPLSQFVECRPPMKDQVVAQFDL